MCASAGATSGAHSTVNRESRALVRSCSGDTGRSVKDSTDTTGRPVPSAASSRTVSPPACASRTRRPVAPVPCSVTRDHAKGSRGPSAAGTRPPAPSACRAESSRAGCTPNPPVSACASSVTASSA